MRKEENPKVLALYQAVAEFITENADVNLIKVSDITNRAGIGKGTAYDYFTSKEDIIISAILYFEKKTIEEIKVKLEEHVCFQEKIYYLFHVMDSKKNEKVCFFKYLHLTMGTEKIGELIKERIKLEDGMQSHPISMVYYLTLNGIEEGVIDKKYPISYLVAALASKLVTYMLYTNYKENGQECGEEEFKDLLYQGLMREIG